ncbi:MAG: hypothetical protein GF383_09875 [Candidatus Lokiarchaeota archaeon]|nr:hypothetical protein [Candidatus Lokiarchaeota archaeon]MBD3340839.1 hypothetical protein [Candidatus Lokiarchaeota archaeon]
MVLGTLEIATGAFNLVFVGISTLVGFMIMSRYFRYKEINLLLVGLSWIGVGSPYWASSISFLLALTIGVGLSLQGFLFFAIFFVPIFLTFWVIAFTNFLYPNKQKVILTIYLIDAVLFEVFFLYYLFTTPDLIGELDGIVNMRFKSFVMIWLFIHVILFMITGLLFAGKALKSDAKKNKTRGIFITIAFISFTIGSAFNVIAPTAFIISRIILIISAISFYLGWITPRWLVKKID